MPTGLIRRGGAYSLRRRIPKDLLASYGGRKEIVRALGTSDREEAKRLHARAWVSLDEEFTARRNVSAQHSVLPSPVAAYGQWQSYPQEEFEAALAEMDRDSERTAQADYDAEQRQPARDAVRGLLTRPVASLSEEDLAIREVLESFRDEAATRLPWASQPVAIEQSVVADSPPSNPDLISFDELIERWRIETRPTPQTVRDRKSVIRLFLDEVGDISPHLVRISHVRSFKDRMISDGLGPSNIQTKLSRLKGLMSFAHSNGYIETNPSRDIVMTVRAEDRKERTAWSKEDLRNLFSGPVHAKGERPARGRGEAAYWLPLLALYTGARLEELAQLKPHDIRLIKYDDSEGNEQSYWFMEIKSSEDGSQRLKTISSARLVPLHPVLLELGFHQFAKNAQDMDQELIFPKLTRGSHDKLGAKWGEWFTIYRRQCGVVGTEVPFHALRHTFARMARDKNINETLVNHIMGHKPKSVSEMYGRGYSPHALVRAIRQYDIPGFKVPDRPADLL